MGSPTLLYGIVEAADLAWSPDGEWIAYTQTGGLEIDLPDGDPQRPVDNSKAPGSWSSGPTGPSLASSQPARRGEPLIPDLVVGLVVGRVPGGIQRRRAQCVEAHTVDRGDRWGRADADLRVRLLLLRLRAARLVP